MKKIKLSIYLEPAQLKMINEIMRVTRQSRALIFREAVNCYLTLSREKKENRNEVV